MPSAEARTAGENTRLASGSAWHQVRSTSSPNAVSAAPYGAGLGAGSVYATPRATVGAVAGDDPVPAQAASMATSTTGTRAPRARCHRIAASLLACRRRELLGRGERDLGDDARA